MRSESSTGLARAGRAKLQVWVCPEALARRRGRLEVWPRRRTGWGAVQKTCGGPGKRAEGRCLAEHLQTLMSDVHFSAKRNEFLLRPHGTHGPRKPHARCKRPRSVGRPFCATSRRCKSTETERR